MTPGRFVAILARPVNQDTKNMSDHTEAGKLYFGFLCHSPQCALPIIVGEIRHDQLDAAGGAQIGFRQEENKLECPHCKTTSVYRSNTLQRFHAAEKGKLS